MSTPSLAVTAAVGLLRKHGVARRRCLRPRGMTAYPRTFNLAVNLAERVLFVLFYERQTLVFVLHVLSHICQTQARVPAASPAHTRRNRLCPTSSSAEHEFGFVVPLGHANPLHSFAPLDFFSRTHGSGLRLIVDPARTLRCSLSVHLWAFALLHPGADVVCSSCYVSPASRELACLYRCNVLPPSR